LHISPLWKREIKGDFIINSYYNNTLFGHFDLLLEIFLDRDSLEETYEEWTAHTDKALSRLIRRRASALSR